MSKNFLGVCGSESLGHNIGGLAYQICEDNYYAGLDVWEQILNKI